MINIVIIKIAKYAALILFFLMVVIPLLAGIVLRIISQASQPSDPKAAKARGEELARERHKTIFVVVAHPDDADWYAGGTLTILSREGNKVIVVVGTSGEKGGNGVPELAKVREEEQWRSGELLGYDEIIFLRHPDRGLEANSKLKDQISKLIDKYKPEILFTFDTERENYIYRHSDHEAAGKASLEVARESQTIKNIYLFHSSAPNIIFDISKYASLKTEALAQHTSQRNPGIRASRTRGLLRYFLYFLAFISGRGGSSSGFNESFPQVGVKAAEVFRRIEQ